MTELSPYAEKPFLPWLAQIENINDVTFQQDDALPHYSRHCPCLPERAIRRLLHQTTRACGVSSVIPRFDLMRLLFAESYQDWCLR